MNEVSGVTWIWKAAPPEETVVVGGHQYWVGENDGGWSVYRDGRMMGWLKTREAAEVDMTDCFAAERFIARREGRVA